MIAIKGMEMPKHCMTCEFYDQMYNMCNIGHFETGAKFIKGDDKWYFKHPNCPLVEIVTCKDCKQWKDSDGVYRRGLGAESKCPINTKEVCEGNFYCADGEKRGNKDDLLY